MTSGFTLASSPYGGITALSADPSGPDRRTSRGRHRGRVRAVGGAIRLTACYASHHHVIEPAAVAQLCAPVGGGRPSGRRGVQAGSSSPRGSGRGGRAALPVLRDSRKTSR